MNFKEQLKKDMKEVFFSESEFAESILIEDKKLIGIISRVNFNRQYKYKENITGLNQEGLIVYLKTEDLPIGMKFLTGEIININNSEFTIIKSIFKEYEYEVHVEKIGEN